MTAIWRNDGTGWRPLAPTGFPDEAALHSLVEQAPQLLPLSGNPQLIVVGKEVLLGNGSADLIAVEPSGRLVVIEVKLARNAEARRAVVAQALTYAAYLRGIAASDLEKNILGRHLQQRKYKSLAEAVKLNDQEGSFDHDEFAKGLKEGLAQGWFRIVFVLDGAPEELVQLVGYLESIADKLIIDLVTVSAYDVDGTQILVPQRVDAERQPDQHSTPPPRSKSQGRSVPGADDFVRAIDQAPEKHHATLRRLSDWAISLEREGLVKLTTYYGKSGLMTLLPRLLADNVGLVTIYSDKTGGYFQMWRSVFERRAPNSIARVEEIIHPAKISQGNTVREISDELLAALTQAYREAALGKIADTPAEKRTA
ncbi:MAG TPA: hypothetical protein VFL17_10345 [Anaerolineae bacterium]|nr:hypothetical protein [Anaerolineae bacterium]